MLIFYRTFIWDLCRIYTGFTWDSEGIIVAYLDPMSIP